jgi:MFS family permease
MRACLGKGLLVVGTVALPCPPTCTSSCEFATRRCLRTRPPLLAVAPPPPPPPPPLRTSEHRWHLISLYTALFSLISVMAVTTQALPGVLAASIGQPERVAEALGAWTAVCAALEFVSLPAIGAWSDAVGRRPLMLLLAAVSLGFRILVACFPCAETVILSRMVVASLVNGYILLVSASTADLFQRDSALLAGFEGKTAACWGLAYAVGM